ncbi:MAG TPA: peptidyl-prolyl cis-trans isomerase [Anaeromyxobacteraceae bacterium]|jgi:peptidyl-prolyl cis-trans isomerase C
MRRVTFALALALAASGLACGKAGEKKGPLVAEGNGVAISAADFKARIDEQSPFIRSRYTTLERKKEFLDNLVRFEVLAREAERQGLDKDPEVLLTVKRVMVNKLVQRAFGDAQDAARSIPEADLKSYYDQHRDDYVKPLRLRFYHVLLKAPAQGAERARKQAEARKLLERVRAEEKKNPAAFVGVAREKSQDEATKNLGGDLGFKSREELEKVLGKAAAEKGFAMKDGEVGGPFESAQGLVLLKLAGRQEAIDRTFDQVKPAIAQKLQRERKTKEFEEFQKKLREAAQVKVNDAELEKVVVAAGPPVPGGAPGMMPSPASPPMRPPMQAPPAPAPARK